MSKRKGPGYATPLDAMKHGPRETFLYTTCVQPNSTRGSDFLATIDVDPKSSNYCKIIHTLHTENTNDEIHHTGWNVCSSCHVTKGGEDVPVRDKLIMPALGSSRVYVVDTSVEREPKMFKVIDASAMKNLDSSSPHTTHCLPTGEIMISTLGNANGDSKGQFILIDSKTFDVTGVWTEFPTKFGYDFWYQPYHDILVSSEWGVPNRIKNGFNPADVADGYYGHSLNLYSWKERKLIQTIDLKNETDSSKSGDIPLEIRFLHDPMQAQGFVGCALYANVFRFFKKSDGKWDAKLAINIPSKKVEGWALPEMPGLISDILISLDDKYLYVSCWFHGDVRQYDISDPKRPKLVGQIFLEGLLTEDSNINVTYDPEPDTLDPNVKTKVNGKVPRVVLKGKHLKGGPQMLQLSLDGKRLYVTSSLYSPWDRQFYPDLLTEGAWMAQLDVNIKKGGMKINSNFLVDFGNTSHGPVLAHETRYPGGDCSSDIWLPKGFCCK